MHATLDYRVAEGVATLTLNRPEAMNAIDMVLRRELLEAVREAAGDADVRAVVLAGSGGHFCAGGDVKTMGQIASAGEGRQRMLNLQPLVAALLHLPKPLVAAVEGVAYGAGFGLALTADFIVAGDSARFCCSFARMGLVPDFALAFTLPRIVGLQRAKALVFSARVLDANDALAQGLVTEVCTAGGALDRAGAMARALSTGSPLAFDLAKRMLMASFQSDASALLAMEADAQGIACVSGEHREAARRFKAKEPLAFTGVPAPSTKTRGV